MITIKICHANDVVRDGWKVVEHITSITEVEEHLASPNFDWSEGTCVRVSSIRTSSDVSIVYDGIFNQETLVNVGPNSSVTSQFSWSYSDVSFRYLKDFGWVKAWRHCRSPRWMIEGVKNIISPMMILRTVCDVIELAHKQSGDTRRIILKAIDGVRKFSTDEIDFDDLQKIEARVPKTIDRYDDMLRSTNFMLDSVSNINAASDAVFYAASVFANNKLNFRHEEAIAEFMRIIHKNIPFYDIAKVITK